MSEKEERRERPCLHCLMVELIDDFFAEYPATAGSDKVDTDEARCGREPAATGLRTFSGLSS
jgi:hypothetical protein